MPLATTRNEKIVLALLVTLLVLGLIGQALL